MTRYRDSLDRSGWALALGGASVGIGTMLVGWAGEDVGPAGLVGYWLVGAMLGLIVIAGVGGPAWWLVQRRGWRGPMAAGITGAGVAGGVTLFVMTQGFGAGLTSGYAAAVWFSAAATALVAAFLGGLIALAMWLVRYPPSRAESYDAAGSY